MNRAFDVERKMDPITEQMTSCQFSQVRDELHVCLECKDLEKIIGEQRQKIKDANQQKADLENELLSLKESFRKYKIETIEALNNFRRYKIKMESNASLHYENMMSYINLIKKKNSEIEILRSKQ